MKYGSFRWEIVPMFCFHSKGSKRLQMYMLRLLEACGLRLYRVLFYKNPKRYCLVLTDTSKMYGVDIRTTVNLLLQTGY